MNAFDRDGLIDYDAIEREAQRLRHQAAAEMLSVLRGWMARHRQARMLTGTRAA